MDFSWANGHGPVDQNSPFFQLSQQNRPGNGKSECIRHNVIDSTSNMQLGSHSVLDSPSKSKPEFPSLRPAFGQTTLFSNVPVQGPDSPSRRTDKPLRAHPNPSIFNTPRKFDIEPSSGGETPDTPGNNADSEATPDNMALKGLQPVGEGEDKKSPKKKRESIFGRIWAGSPGRDIKSYSTKGEKRVRKRRAQNAAKQLLRRKDYIDDDSDGEKNAKDRQDSAANPASPTSWLSISSVFTYIESHPQLPHILSFYAQLLLNLFLVFSCMYILYSFWATILSDVDKKSDEAIAEAMAEMAVCAKNYRDNGCADRRAPALEQVCLAWEKCMAKDPKRVGRARVSAHTFAEIFNSFIEPISYKAMIFSLIFIFACILISNVAFGFFRNKMQHDAYLHYPPPPPTPQRQGSNPAQLGMYTPYHHASLPPMQSPWVQMGLEPAPSQEAGGAQSPSKRLEYQSLRG